MLPPRIRFSDFFCFFSLLLDFVLLFFSLHFSLGGRQQHHSKALESKASIDGIRKEMAERLASLQPRPGNREVEHYAARASPLWCEYE